MNILLHNLLIVLLYQSPTCNIEHNCVVKHPSRSPLGGMLLLQRKRHWARQMRILHKALFLIAATIFSWLFNCDAPWIDNFSSIYRHLHAHLWEYLGTPTPPPIIYTSSPLSFVRHSITEGRISRKRFKRENPPLIVVKSIILTLDFHCELQIPWIRN